MPYCPRCGEPASPETRFCQSCGQDLATPVVMTVSGGRQQRTMLPQSASPTASTVRYASLGERFVASIIDLILVAVVTVIISIPFGIAAWMGSFFASPFAAAFNGLFFGGFTFIIWILYYSYFEGTSGQTLGKSAMSIRVVDQNTGQTIDMARAFIRSLLRIIDFLPVLYFIGFIIVLATPRKQRLGDIAAGTVVVKS
jgi:uncharacterized RDD family membrane protein YckC